MNDSPFPAFAHPDGNRLHNPAAITFPVAGFNIHVKAAQAIGAMVAMITAGAFRCAKSSADLAGKAVLASMCFILTLFKGFAFIFAIHGKSS